MNMVSPVGHINGGMHLDPADLSSGQILLIVDVMNLVVLNQRENTAKMSDDSRLSAVMNIAAPDHVGTDCFSGPSFPLRLADTVPLGLRPVLEKPGRPLILISLLKILSEGNAAAS